MKWTRKRQEDACRPPLSQRRVDAVIFVAFWPRYGCTPASRNRSFDQHGISHALFLLIEIFYETACDCVPRCTLSPASTKGVRHHAFCEGCTVRCSLLQEASADCSCRPASHIRKLLMLWPSALRQSLLVLQCRLLRITDCLLLQVEREQLRLYCIS